MADASTPIDPAGYFDYLYFHCIPSPGTIYKGIYRIPPGHTASMHNGGQVTPHWVPKFDEIQNPSFDALKGEFRQVLQESVGARLAAANRPVF
ncbi:MAG: hypothetical protein IPI16_17820 [Comamonadaceae bacterium]|nr:hypothetical protein [Comamonadaceae bacterium]